MEPEVYWRSALGLFWAFMFFMLLMLVVGMTFLSSLLFSPYAAFFSAILVLFLVGFLLFDKRIKAGFYLCLVLSALFVLNQALLIFALFASPASLFPSDISTAFEIDQNVLFPIALSFMFLLWALILFVSVWKSKPLFEPEKAKEDVKWLSTAKSFSSEDKVKPAGPVL